MNPTEFCYWLNGFFELSDEKDIGKYQVDIIKDHLRLVFEKVDKSHNSSTTNSSKLNNKKVC